jgi:hypothetical protein
MTTGIREAWALVVDIEPRNWCVCVQVRQTFTGYKTPMGADFWISDNSGAIRAIHCKSIELLG